MRPRVGKKLMRIIARNLFPFHEIDKCKHSFDWVVISRKSLTWSYCAAKQQTRFSTLFFGLYLDFGIVYRCCLFFCSFSPFGSAMREIIALSRRWIGSWSQNTTVYGVKKFTVFSVCFAFARAEFSLNDFMKFDSTRKLFAAIDLFERLFSQPREKTFFSLSTIIVKFCFLESFVFQTWNLKMFVHECHSSEIERIRARKRSKWSHFVKILFLVSKFQTKSSFTFLYSVLVPVLFYLPFWLPI